MVHTHTDAKERLLAAALALATSEGVDAVSTRAVCAAAGVRAPTLYHHFGDRAGLIRAVVDRAFEEYFAAKHLRAPATPAVSAEAELAAGWDAHIAFARAHPGLYPAMYPAAGTPSSHMERSAALLEAGFERLAQEGALAPGVSPELATAVLRAALRGVAHAVAAAPGEPCNDHLSTITRDAIIARLIRHDEGKRTHD